VVRRGGHRAGGPAPPAELKKAGVSWRGPGPFHDGTSRGGHQPWSFAFAFTALTGLLRPVGSFPFPQHAGGRGGLRFSKIQIGKIWGLSRTIRPRARITGFSAIFLGRGPCRFRGGTVMDKPSGVLRSAGAALALRPIQGGPGRERPFEPGEISRDFPGCLVLREPISRMTGPKGKKERATGAGRRPAFQPTDLCAFGLIGKSFFFARTSLPGKKTTGRLGKGVEKPIRVLSAQAIFHVDPAGGADSARRQKFPKRFGKGAQLIGLSGGPGQSRPGPFTSSRFFDRICRYGAVLVGLPGVRGRRINCALRGALVAGRFEKSGPGVLLAPKGG